MLDPVVALVDVPSAVLRWPVVIVAGALLVILVASRARSGLVDRMGLQTPDIALLTIGAIAAPALNVPLGIVGGTVLAVNLGGAIVPLLVIWRLRGKGRVPWVPFGVLSVGVAGATWWVVSVDAQAGVVASFPWFLVPSAVAFVGALLLGGRGGGRGGPLAFASGSVGALVGADVLTLPALADAVGDAPGGSALVLGGGGALDLIFLSGAVGLAGCLAWGALFGGGSGVLVGDPRADPVRVPRARALVREAQRVHGLSPRERCLVSLARANLALEGGAWGEAVDHACEGAGALLSSGDPRLLDRVEEEGPGRVRAWVEELREARGRVREQDPSWEQAADAVELAKAVCGSLWAWAPGRVRLEGAL